MNKTECVCTQLSPVPCAAPAVRWGILAYMLQHRTALAAGALTRPKAFLGVNVISSAPLGCSIFKSCYNSLHLCVFFSWWQRNGAVPRCLQPLSVLQSGAEPKPEARAGPCSQMSTSELRPMAGFCSTNLLPV